MNIIDRINEKVVTFKLNKDSFNNRALEAFYECIMEDVKQLIGNSDELKEENTK